MSVEQAKKKLKKLNIERFQEMLTEKGASHNCPMCSKQAWVYMGAADIVGLSLPFGDERGEIYMSGVAVLPLVCKSCGFMRMHNLDYFRDALEEVNAPEQGGENDSN